MHTAPDVLPVTQSTVKALKACASSDKCCSVSQDHYWPILVVFTCLCCAYTVSSLNVLSLFCLDNLWNDSFPSSGNASVDSQSNASGTGHTVLITVGPIVAIVIIFSLVSCYSL